MLGEKRGKTQLWNAGGVKRRGISSLQESEESHCSITSTCPQAWHSRDPLALPAQLHPGKTPSKLILKSKFENFDTKAVLGRKSLLLPSIS